MMPDEDKDKSEDVVLESILATQSRAGGVTPTPDEYSTPNVSGEPSEPVLSEAELSGQPSGNVVIESTTAAQTGAASVTATTDDNSAPTGQPDETSISGAKLSGLPSCNVMLDSTIATQITARSVTASTNENPIPIVSGEPSETSVSEAETSGQCSRNAELSSPISESTRRKSRRSISSSPDETSLAQTNLHHHRVAAVGFKFVSEEILLANERNASEACCGERHSAGAESDIESRAVSRFRSLSSRFFKKAFPESPKANTFRETLFLAFRTLGVVYGDLGTSPLYVYPTINVTNPTESDFLGILSLIFWTLTLIGILKYTLIVLRADDHGEGGTFAVYSLLCQHANIGQDAGDDNQEMSGPRRSQLSEHAASTKQNRTKRFLEGSVAAQRVLLFVVMMGTCMLVGDGILTPAISVLSAIEGIQTAAPSLNRAVVVVVSAVILVVLFACQRFGTHRVSSVFSPIMALWLITTPIVAAYNIAIYYPGIFKAFSPAHIYYFFKQNKKNAWLMLGGTILCITGAEAMYADMGHFDKRSIQLAFTTMVYPSVLVTYAGQTAYLIKHPEDHREGFFKMVPKKVYWPVFVVATLAAIVASQGLISATFSIIKQSTALHYFPRVKLVHTSENKEGQIYSPEVNYVLMVLCLAVVFGFRKSGDIGNAFGVAVVAVMLITTCLISLVMLVIWQTPVFLVLPFFLLFIVVEGTYMSAVVTKVPQGGWLPFAVSLIVTLIMFSWNMGCQTKVHYEMRNKITKEKLGELLAHGGSARVPGICFFYTNLLHGVPPIIGHYVRNVRSLHRVLVFTTIRWMPVRRVLPAERFLVGRVGFSGVYRCVARYGYRDVLQMQNDEFVDQFVATLSEYIMATEQTNHAALPQSLQDNTLSPLAIASEIADLNQAKADGPVYVLGRSELTVSRKTRMATRIFVGVFYRFLEANCRSEVSTMDIPYAQYLELGMLYDII
ncbi:KUP system potassium uptake protein [Marchantia polymorpha subsp. ruderalis]|uniref:Potassium transporter n=2 Tax=Marchantia polymorpha TaxID=3197 RepID=A0AAF6ANY4_MARPO|nr:hypothetical protein MARPO_0014s0103 [Marchantia polymorpha]BBM98154.1 hypothetical protein Mp_1g11240 [Marchantia polymorpha subsp. ruderalis]|eukprot:PTQ45571.1 hypothetical protein MARPO_0014s0103 [Marchantia polymorpha]